MSGHEAARPIAGLPEQVPEGERVLWTGTPDMHALALRVFHARKVAIYFLLLAVWRAWSVGAATTSFGAALGATVPLLGLGAGAVGILVLFAWLTARNSVYLVTDDRVFMKVGIAFPKYVNLPMDEIDSATERRARDGSGDVAFRPVSGTRIPYFLLWPHARPWRLSAPQPALRAISDVGDVVRILRDALGAHAPGAHELRPAASSSAIEAAPQTARPAGPAALLDRKASGA